ncbi:MAG: AraC family transcriptional regulator [Bacteroidota bacterium]
MCDFTITISTVRNTTNTGNFIAIYDNELEYSYTYAYGNSLKPNNSNTENNFLQKLQNTLKINYQNTKFTLANYAQRCQMSYTQFYRKLKALTNQTPSQYIRAYRLEQAKSLLKNPAFNISEVAYEVGFSDPNYFTRAFSREFGMPPNAYRTQVQG